MSRRWTMPGRIAPPTFDRPRIRWSSALTRVPVRKPPAGCVDMPQACPPRRETRPRTRDGSRGLRREARARAAGTICHFDRVAGATTSLEGFATRPFTAPCPRADQPSDRRARLATLEDVGERRSNPPGRALRRDLQVKGFLRDHAAPFPAGRSPVRSGTDATRGPDTHGDADVRDVEDRPREPRDAQVKEVDDLAEPHAVPARLPRAPAEDQRERPARGRRPLRSPVMKRMNAATTIVTTMNDQRPPRSSPKAAPRCARTSAGRSYPGTSMDCPRHIRAATRCFVI